jgi:hypothetical protein
MPHCPNVAPVRDPIEEGLSLVFGEHLRVANLVDPTIPRDDRGSDRQRTGPCPPADLIDANDDLTT